MVLLLKYFIYRFFYFFIWYFLYLFLLPIDNMINHLIRDINYVSFLTNLIKYN